MEKVYSKAKKFINKNGTVTQKTIFDYLIGKVEKEDVVSQLQKFQNEDGGWANGLEVEYQGDISSIMTTVTALGYIYLFGLDDTRLFDKTIIYLEKTQKESGYWDDLNVINKFNIPPYYLPGKYLEYKTGMILKWLRRLKVDHEMILNGYDYLLKRYKANIKSDDMWTAIAYINAFTEYTHDKTQEIIEWASNIIMKPGGVDHKEDLPWEKVQGMIYDDSRVLINIQEKVMHTIKINQMENGGWPHQFGVYNQVWAAILIVRFLKMTEKVKI